MKGWGEIVKNIMEKSMKTSWRKKHLKIWKKNWPKKYGNKKISAMSSAYWMNVAKSYGDLLYTPKSLPYF